MATRIFQYHGLRGETLPFNTGARRTFLPSRARAMPGVPWGAVPHPYSRARAYGGFGETAAEAAAAKAAAEKAAAAKTTDWGAIITGTTTVAKDLFGMWQATTDAAARRRLEARMVAAGQTPPSMMPAPVTQPLQATGGGGGGGGILIPLIAAVALGMRR